MTFHVFQKITSLSIDSKLRWHQHGNFDVSDERETLNGSRV